MASVFLRSSSLLVRINLTRSPNSLTACSLERAKEDGSSVHHVPAGPCFCGNAVRHQRGVVPVADLPLHHHHF